jgi:hypothetical protein
MITELERAHRVQLCIRAAVWIIALALLATLVPSCKTLKNAPADAVIVGGTAGSTLAAAAIGGPAGLAVGAAGVIASVVTAEEVVRTQEPVIKFAPQIPGGAVPPPAPPWYLSPKYWWGVIILTLAASFLLKFIFGARFRAHIRNAVWAFMSGQIKAGFAYLLAASGPSPGADAERKDGSA